MKQETGSTTMLNSMVRKVLIAVGAVAVLAPMGCAQDTGNDPTGTTQTAPTAEPAATSGTFTATGSLQETGRTPGVLLNNGKVLIAGFADDTAELYDPSTGTFSATASGTFFPGSATVLADGKVLLTALLGTAAELYDPSTGTFSPTGSLNVERDGFSTIRLLSNGQVLAFGGYEDSTAELYNPATGTWTFTESLAAPGAGAALLQSGQLLVAGGGADGTSAELYNPSTGTWTATGSMIFPGGQAIALQSGEVLVVDGGGDDGIQTSQLYDPATGTWGDVVELPFGSCDPDEPCFSGGEAVLLQSGKVLVAGGLVEADYGSALTSLARLYDPSTNTWSTAGYMTAAREDFVATVLNNGQVLIAGGEQSSAELYTP